MLHEATLMLKLTFSILPHAFHIGREVFCNQCNEGVIVLKLID